MNVDRLEVLENFFRMLLISLLAGAVSIGIALSCRVIFHLIIVSILLLIYGFWKAYSVVHNRFSPLWSFIWAIVIMIPPVAAVACMGFVWIFGYMALTGYHG
ncbi:MAG: hypothetical protein K6F33_09605 [Bacteroidales bacterium]|nr:hypothetical protein [Bacteroidales bacterium]